MIHSLSGGVIAENREYLFAKVEIEGVPYWYVSPFPALKEGDRVLVPFGKGDRLTGGTVLKTELCTRQTAPYPLNRVREIAEVL